MHLPTTPTSGRRWPLLLIYWLIVFLLYIQTTHAGYVSDYTGWLKLLRQDSFSDFINRRSFGTKSLYQLTQFNTWAYYQLFGVNYWAWHLLFVSWHAVNCWLVFLVVRRMLTDGGFMRPMAVGVGAGLLYAISPYHTEVVVWEPSFHYPQAITFMCCILLLLQHYLRRPQIKYMAGIGLLYFMSSFGHELHFITPWLCLGTIILYRSVIGWPRTETRSAMRRIVPLVFVLFIAHLFIFFALYGRGVPRVGPSLLGYTFGHYAFGAPFYYYHLAAWGRFWPEGTKQQVYDLLRTSGGAITFYLLLLVSLLVPLLRYKRMARYSRLIYFVWLMLLGAVAFVVPLYLPVLLRVECDRYTYFMLIPWSILLALLINLIPKKPLRIAVYAMLVLVNVALTWRTNILWRDSARMVKHILTHLPPLNGKTGVFLNVPACYKGVPMIGSTREGETRLMHNLLYEPVIKDSLLDVVAYNLISPNDGAHVEVTSDSTLKVTLNQWGTWWWTGGYGASSFETEHYRVNMVDVGHWYEITLKKPAEEFIIFYQVGDSLKIVDMALRGVPQQ